MAPKKKSETKSKKTETETKSKATTSKTKKSKTVKLTFAPIMGAAEVYKALLREKVVKKSYGKDVITYQPAIEGLPVDFVVKKGEIVEVTEEQFEQLQKRGHVETDEEYKKRQEFIDNLSSQHPETLTWEMILAEGSNFSTLLDSQNIIYNDKLIKVE